jgi:hypothetical protein
MQTFATVSTTFFFLIISTALAVFVLFAIFTILASATPRAGTTCEAHPQHGHAYFPQKCPAVIPIVKFNHCPNNLCGHQVRTLH